MTPAQRVRLRLAVRDNVRTIGGWVIALWVVLTPLVIAIALIRFAVQRWG